MTRYQCIKNFPPFQAGKVYIGSEPDNRSNRGRILMNVSSDIEPVFLTPAQLIEHFEFDEESIEYSYFLQPSRGCVIATAITVALIAAGLYFAFLY